MWYAHTTEYYSTLKKNKEILKCEKTWTNPENIMLSKRNQTQKSMYSLLPFTGSVMTGRIKLQ